MEPFTEKVAVTFHDGLPIGTRGTFTHNGQRWIALPHNKYVRIVSAIDRLIGALAGIQDDMLRMINDHPADAVRIASILGRIKRVRTLHRELATDKVKAQTEIIKVDPPKVARKRRTRKV